VEGIAWLSLIACWRRRDADITTKEIGMKLRITTMAMVAMMAMAFVFGTGATAAAAQQNQPGGGLVIPNVSGSLLLGTQQVGELTHGAVTVTRLQERGGQLLATGTLTGTAQGQPVIQQFTDVPVTLVDPNGGACDILNLDLGPLNLDLLGLVVDLSPISLDVTALPGAGNLLGNLLCAVAGLLDQNPAGGLNGILNELLGIINRLLGGLG
jgi:hypothetical protein